MSGARNRLCRCRKSGAYRTRAEAQAVLDRIMNEPPNPVDPRPYKPTRVTRCAAGIWHLTAKSGKSWGSGKRRRGHTT